MNYSAFIEQFSVILWLLDFTILIAVAYFSKRDCVFSSTLVALLVVAIIDGLMNSYTPDLKAFIRDNRPPDGDTLKYSWGLFSWYIGFMFLNVVAMFAIYRIHLMYKISMSVPTYAYLLAYLCLTFLHVIRYSERLLWDTEITQAFYKTSILSINVGTSITALVVVIGFAISRWRINNGKTGLQWSL